MKKSQIIVVVLVLTGYTVYTVLWGFTFYKQLFSNIGAYDWGFTQITVIVQMLLSLIKDLLEIVLAIVCLVSPNMTTKNRAYQLLRYMFVLYFSLCLPVYLEYLSPKSYFYTVSAGAKFGIVAMAVFNLVCFICLLIAKPAKQVARTDLRQYEIVAYTGPGHRLAHYFLDVLFVLPVWIFWTNSLIYFFPETGILLAPFIPATTYLLYCFLSEHFFRQTFGKFLTNSCVVSTRGNLSASKIAGRTFARLIPFDAISYLFGANWHDKVSATTVVYIDTWKKAFEETEA